MNNRNLLHLNINLKDSKNFEHIKFVCMGGCATRMKNFASKFSESSHISLSEKYNCGKRYVFYMVGPVLFVNHGMGIPSINIRDCMLSFIDSLGSGLSNPSPVPCTFK